MSKSHKRYLPIIKRHVQAMGYGDAHIEVQYGRSGERCDVWGRALVPITGWLPNPEGTSVEINLWTNATSVHEFKHSVQDLRVDLDKPWRKPGVRALGDHRFYWLHRDGAVRPEHIDDDRYHGWGIVVFDEHGYDIVSVPHRKACSYHDTIGLVAELKDKAWGKRLEELSQNMLRAGMVPTLGGSRQAGSGGSAPAAGKPSVADLIAGFLSSGPANVGTIKGWLKREHGVSLSPPKLIELMQRDDRFARPASAGGAWSVKDDAQGVDAA